VPQALEVKLLLDSKEKITKASSNTFEAWNILAKDLLGKSIFDLLFIEDITSAQHALLSASFMEDKAKFSARVVCGDKSLVPMSWTAQYSKIDRAMLLVAQSGQESSNAGNFRDTLDSLTLIIEDVPTGLFIATLDGLITRTNKALDAIFETEPLKQGERLITSLFPLKEYVSNPVADLLAYYLDQNTSMVVTSSQGRKVPVKFALKKIAVGPINMYLGIVTNLSESFEYKRMKQNFLKTFQTRTRTLLNNILEYVELLQGGYHGVITAEAVNQAQEIAQEIRDFMDFMENLKEIEKLQAGKFQLNLISCNLMTTIKQSLMLLLSDLRDKELALEINGPDAEVPADEDRLLILISTICTFAVRNSPRNAKVRIEIINNADTIRVEVIDRGPGLSKEEQDSIFDASRQPVIPACPGAVGDFTIARNIVEKHGGKIGMISHIGAGTNFWFELPKEAQA
jgi:signal transduction histidine kinase